MKNILVLTNFSENAVHAARSAVMLSGKLHANILLYYSYMNVPVVPYYTVPLWINEDPVRIADDSKKDLDKLAETLLPIVDQLDPSERKPHIGIQCGEGSLSNNIAELIGQMNIELVVMGSSHDSFIDHQVFGSETRSVIEKATCPVLIIPPKADLRLNRIMFATDFEKEDLKAISYLIKIGKEVNSYLDIIHVNIYGKDWAADDKQETAFRAQVAELSYPLVSYKSVAGKELVQRLENLCKEENIGLLALVHHHESFFKRLFKQSSVKKALSGQRLPLMIFPRFES